MLNMLLQPSTWAADFPMVRAGGLFLVIVGFTILAGALLPRKRRLLLMFGFVTGTVMIVLFAAPLAAPAQSPTRSILGSGQRFQDSFRSSDVFRTMKSQRPHLTPMRGVKCGLGVLFRFSFFPCRFCQGSVCSAGGIFMVRKTSELRKLS